ncbi:hypothetical protein LAD67_09665 [Escherichia coli]|nr:hypothetical protein [Escherichia coli]
MANTFAFVVATINNHRQRLLRMVKGFRAASTHGFRFWRETVTMCASQRR